MKRWNWMLALLLVGMPATAFAQEEAPEAPEAAEEEYEEKAEKAEKAKKAGDHEAHDMAREAREMAHEDHDMAKKHAMMMERAESEIAEMAESWSQAISDGDMEALAGFYLEDAVAYPPGSDKLEGRDAIIGWMDAGLEQIGEISMTFETTEVHPMHRPGEGIYAVEIGTFSMDGAEGHLDHGNYMVVWKQTEDGWKVVRDIWNSNMGGGS